VNTFETLRRAGDGGFFVISPPRRRADATRSCDSDEVLRDGRWWVTTKANSWVASVSTHASTATRPHPRESVATLEALAAAGQRHADRVTSARALRHYWSLLHACTRDEREHVHAGLRDRVRSGATTHRAWLPVALGETDDALVMAAVIEYLGAAPISVTRRVAAVADVLDWIRRSLPLRRGAVYAALLAHVDAACFDDLRRLRGSLSRDEARVAWESCASCDDVVVRESIEDWRASFDA